LTQKNLLCVFLLDTGGGAVVVVVQQKEEEASAAESATGKTMKRAWR